MQTDALLFVAVLPCAGASQLRGVAPVPRWAQLRVRGPTSEQPTPTSKCFPLVCAFASLPDPELWLRFLLWNEGKRNVCMWQPGAGCKTTSLSAATETAGWGV